MRKRKWRRFRILWLAAALSVTASAVAAADEAATAKPMPTAAPAPTPTPMLTFSVISDIHVQKWNWRSHDKLKHAMDDLHDALPDAKALVVNGDLGDGVPGDYDTLGKLMGSLPHPPAVFYNIGNHEYYKAWYDQKGYWSSAFPNGETEEASQKRFLDFAGRKKLYEDKWVDGYHFIFLGSEKYRQSDEKNMEDAWLSDAQLTWLEGALQEQEKKDKPIFVFLHQPLPNTVAGSQTEFNNRGVVQHERLKAILSKHPQSILFSGHTHWELGSARTFVQNGFTMVNTSSVYEPYNESDLAYDQEYERSEGIGVQVYPDRVSIRGRDFSGEEWIPQAEFEVKLGK